MFNPKADDEAVVNEQVATIGHIGVGDAMQVPYIRTRSVGRWHATWAEDHAPGSGIVRTTEEFLFTPNVLVSPESSPTTDGRPFLCRTL